MSRALLVLLITAVAAACNGAATVGDVITERIDDTRLEIELVEVHNPAALSDVSVIECEEILSTLTLRRPRRGASSARAGRSAPMVSWRLAASCSSCSAR